MRRRIKCLWHQESTPSLVQRKDGWFCYGACHKLYTTKEVGDRTGETYEYEESNDDKTDIQEELNYIQSLKRVRHRGLEFPTDERGYYIVWPNAPFYKYRVANPGRGPKYVGPRGHVPPLFWARRKGSKALYLVEGEVNALSLSMCVDSDVVSPGSASMFNSDNLARYLTLFKEYSSLIVILDDDAAGRKALIESKAFLLYKIPFLSFVLMKKDCNEVLVEAGAKALQEELQGKNSR